MNKTYIELISGATALAIFVSANAFALQAPISEDLNTDLQLTRQSTVSIVDQQSPVLDASGDPVIDDNGNEETYDVTSVNLNLFYTYDNKFKSDLAQGIANQGSLNLSVEPAGFCTFLEGGMRPDNDTQPFEIPLGQLRKGPGVAPLLTTYLFEGLAGPQFIVVEESLAEALNPGEPVGQPIPPADSQGGFNGTPFANMTMSLTLLNAGEVTLDGITDVSEVLGVPQGKVDVVMTLLDEGILGASPDFASPSPAAVAACLPNVTPTVTIVPVAPAEQPVEF